jgi:GMP synthase (glutamine-hydrolysing)
MRPFLLLSIRADEEAADDEHRSVLRFAGLSESQVRRVRLADRPLGPIDLADYSGVILGGGPFNVSDPADTKSAVQRRVEVELLALTRRLVDADFPFLGCCYGIGVLGSVVGATIDRGHSEPVGAIRIALTADAGHDPLFAGLPAEFDAFGGHKEAAAELPDHVVRLASSRACPVQAFRVGANVYATQFHPELDAVGLCTRIDVYKDHGYFPPESAEDLKIAARRHDTNDATTILRRFAERYAKP